MKTVTVDKKTCIGCGSCVAIASKTFALSDDGKAIVINPSGDLDDVIQQAVDGCPVGSITVIK
jgi:ferredoxin